jgi:hypothetical protein
MLKFFMSITFIGFGVALIAILLGALYHEPNVIEFAVWALVVGIVGIVLSILTMLSFDRF